MPHYYLDLYNRVGPVADEEGQDFPDESAARAKALESIREMVSADALDGILHLVGRIEVLDAQRQLVATVTFGEAFNVTLEDASHD